MGSIVNAFCGCGINKILHVGRGFNDFGYYEPVICFDCKDVSEEFKGSTSCQKCSGKNIIVIDPDELNKQDTKEGHKCPNCGKLTLWFAHNGFWD